jgi:UDP-glucose 4-epimerase
VDDVVDAFLRAGASHETNGQVYNLGGLEPVSLLELSRLIIEIAGRGRVELVPWPPARKRIDIGDVYSSSARAEQALGWRPTTPLRAGLERMIAYYEEFGEYYW